MTECTKSNCHGALIEKMHKMHENEILKGYIWYFRHH